MSNKNASTARAIGWLILVLLVIVILVFLIADKKEERQKLEEFRKRLEKDEAEILALKERNEKIFNITYGIIKGIFVAIILTIIGLTVYFTKANSFFDYIANCTTIFGGIGMITVISCVIFEQNPLDVFKARAFFKNFIFELINEPHKKTFARLPEIQTEKIKVEEGILKIDTEIKQLNFLEIAK